MKTNHELRTRNFHDFIVLPYHPEMQCVLSTSTHDIMLVVKEGDGDLAVIHTFIFKRERICRHCPVPRMY